MDGANTGSYTTTTNTLSATWPSHPINNSGATTVVCDITGHDAQGNSITTAGSPSCQAQFSAGTG